MKLILINLLESILLTWFLLSFSFINQHKNIGAFVLILFNFSVITISNYIIVYDIFLTTFLLLFDAYILYFFSINTFYESLLITCIESVFLSFVNGISFSVCHFIDSINIYWFSKILYFILSFFVIRFLKNKVFLFEKKLILIITIILFSLQFIMGHLYQIYFFYESDYPDLIIIFLLFEICVIAFVFILLEMAELYQFNVTSEKWKQSQEYGKDITFLYNEIKIAKHDLKHIYQLLYFYLRNHKYEEMNQFLLIKEQNVNEIPSFVNSSNDIINQCVNNRLIVAYRNNIQIECTIDVHQKIAMESKDLNELLLNLLDYGISCCSKKESFVFNVIQEVGSLTFQLKNLICENHFQNEKNKLLYSRIQKIVYLYHGIIEDDFGGSLSIKITENTIKRSDRNECSHY